MGVSVCMCRRVDKKHEAKIFLLLEDILPPIWPQNKIIIGFLKKKILLIILIIVINGI